MTTTKEMQQAHALRGALAGLEVIEASLIDAAICMECGDEVGRKLNHLANCLTARLTQIERTAFANWQQVEKAGQR
jgi:hypothetical protein